MHSAIDRLQRATKGGGEEGEGSHRSSHRKLAVPASAVPLQISPPTSPHYGTVSANGDAGLSPSFSLRPQLNGHSNASSPLLLAAWNPFGFLLALNPALSSNTAANASSVTSASAPASSPASPTAAPPSTSTSSASSFAMETAAAASAAHHLIHRLCALLSATIPDFLRLAHLIATRQLTSGGAGASTASSTPPQSPTGASAAAGFSATPAPLQGVSAEHRQAINALLDGLFHQFSAYVRLALFPVSAEELQQWEQAGPVKRAGSAETNGAGSASSTPMSSPQLAPLAGPSTSPKTTGSSVPSASLAVDKSTEHAAFSLDEPPSHSAHLPLIAPPLPPSSLPLPSSLWQTIHLLLRCHSSMQDLGLSAESLQQLHALRSVVVRWYVARVVQHTKAAVEGLKEEETWQLVDEKKERRGRQSRSAGDSTAATSRRTALPARFHALMQEAVHALTAIPSIKANWMIKCTASPMMDCIKAFAATLQELMQRALKEEEEEEEASNGTAADLMEEGAVTSTSATARRPLPIRLLLLLTNLRYARSVVLPSVLTELLALFPSSTHAVLTDAFARSVVPVYEQLDAQLLQHFLRLHLLALHRRVRDEAYNATALLFHLHSRVEGAKAASRSRGPSVRGVVVDVLLDLVALHADLFFLCPSLIQETLQSLFQGLIQSVSFCCQHCQQGEAGDGGEDEEEVVAASLHLWSGHPQLIQVALLEVEFVERTLEAFSTPDTDAALDEVTDFLLRAQRQSGGAESKAGREEVKGEDEEQLAQVREQQLARDLHATAAMFTAFTLQPVKQTQSKGQKKGGKGKQREEEKKGAHEEEDSEDEDEEDEDALLDEEDDEVMLDDD